MVGQMTYGRRQFDHLDSTMRRLIPPFHAASAQLIPLVDADAQAFAACLVSMLNGQAGLASRSNLQIWSQGQDTGKEARSASILGGPTFSNLEGLGLESMDFAPGKGT